MAFAQVATQLTFAPYSSKSYSVAWNGVLSDGTQLPAGNYRARGVIVSDDFTSDPLIDQRPGLAISSISRCGEESRGAAPWRAAAVRMNDGTRKNRSPP